jgi:hypothetical protein
MAITRNRRLDLGRPQVLALAVGVLYLVIGAAGFLVTSAGPISATGQDSGAGNGMLIVFMVSPLHNVIHLLVGAAGVALAWGRMSARLYGLMLFVAYTAIFAWGVVVTGHGGSNPLALNWPDNWLHLASALVGLLILVIPAGLDRTPLAAAVESQRPG